MMCSKCNQDKDCSEFNKNNRKGRARQYQSYCRVCEKERKLIYDKEYYHKNKDKARAKDIAYTNTEVGRQKHRKYALNYYRNNKALFIARVAKKKAYKLQAALDYNKFKKEIEHIYLNRPEGYHVDHIIPLQGKDVCGLHVPWNLQYLPALENLKKGNRIYD